MPSTKTKKSAVKTTKKSTSKSGSKKVVSKRAASDTLKPVTASKKTIGVAKKVPARKSKMGGMSGMSGM